jgi:hypothetical protein
LKDIESESPLPLVDWRVRTELKFVPPIIFVAVMLAAAKFPEASRATMAEPELTSVAVVALLATLPAVEMVASLLSTIPAAAMMSAFVTKEVVSTPVMSV